jgi:uncharacterized membrane protein
METIKKLFFKNWIFILIIIIGISLKFYRIGYKIFWYDEIATVVQVQGLDSPLEIDHSKLNEIAPISHYNGLLKFDKAGYSIGSELKAQLHNMNLNPLHYTLLSFWYRIAGQSFTGYRLFSVLVFLLTLPFLFGLARELFDSKKAGLIAVSLFSVSPFIQYFAQEARYYMLWAFLLVVLHYFLIKAVHHRKTKWWAGYILFGVLSLYASALSGFIIFEHLLFVFFLKKDLRLKFLIIIAIIFLLYFPWFLFVFNHRAEVSQSLAWHKFETVPLWAPLLGLMLGLVRTFSFYLNYTLFWDDVFHHITTSMIIETFFNLLILVVMIVSVVAMFKKEKRETFWFIILIIVPGILFFWALDIARHAITTHWWRYYIFNTIPVILIVTYIISYYAESRKWLFTTLYAGFIVISLYSVITISQYRYWYLGGDWEQEFVDNAELLSKAKKPLLITDFIRLNNIWEGPMHTMEVLVNCSSDKIDVLRASPDVKQLDSIIRQNHYSDIYVIYASDQLLENLKEQFGERMQILPGRQGPPRWKILLRKSSEKILQ